MPSSSSLGFVGNGAPTRRIGTEPAPPVPLSSLETAAQIDVPQQLLVRWNFAMFLFHTTIAIITLTVGKLDLKVQLYKTAVVFQRRNGTGWDLIPEYVPQGSLYFTVLTATFFLLSALFHLLNVTVLRRFYFRELERCRTPTRWIEYTLSAPVMIVLIAYGLGIRERSLIFAIAALIAVTMPFGYWVELESRPSSATRWSRPLSRRLLPWLIGHLPQMAAWFIIILQFYDGNIEGTETAPWWVYFILWVELALFFSFGAASVVSQWSEPQYFYRGELVFQVLSLVSKGLLGFVLLANVLMLSRFEDIYE